MNDDQRSRLEMMANGDPKWDLSPNDCKAIRACLDRLAELEAVVARGTAEPATASSFFAASAPAKVTDLEAIVLRKIHNGVDPWGGKLGGSRRVSGAVGRLMRKGLVEEVAREDLTAPRYSVRPRGLAVLNARVTKGPRDHAKD